MITEMEIWNDGEWVINGVRCAKIVCKAKRSDIKFPIYGCWAGTEVYFKYSSTWQFFTDILNYFLKVIEQYDPTCDEGYPPK